MVVGKNYPLGLETALVSHIGLKTTLAKPSEMGAGTAFESVARHYERRELPHTLPCHKLI